MVAKITTPQRTATVLNYNEQKVKQGKAACLAAYGYLREAADMNFYQKLEGLESRNALNTRAATKTIHVSLNFDPKEQLSLNTLLSIAEEYINGIGFSDQPYLVYQHRDAGHPHLHIVASAIREDGSRISLHNLGKGASEVTRKRIEKQFNLIQAEDPSRRQKTYESKSLPSPATYGQAETRRTLQTIVEAVRRDYAFCSLAQFNACLRLFGVLADGGKEGSRLQAYGGLHYRILNSDGTPVGVPVKASRLAGVPALLNLQKDFIRNTPRKKELLPQIKQKIDRALACPLQNLSDFSNALRGEKIQALLHRSNEGKLYGLTYIDESLKVAVNGSEIGKNYSASGVLLRLGGSIHETPSGVVKPKRTSHNRPTLFPSHGISTAQIIPSVETGIQQLIAPEGISETPQGSLLPKKKKRKKQKPNQNL